MTQIQHVVALLRRQPFPVVIIVGALRDDAARSRGDLFPQGEDLIRIERHHRRRPAVGGEKSGHPRDQLAVAIELAFHLDEQRNAAGDHRQHVAE